MHDDAQLLRRYAEAVCRDTSSPNADSAAINLKDDSIKQQVEEMLQDAFREVATKGLKPGSLERKETDQRAVASIRPLFSGEQLQAFDARIKSVLEFKLVDWALAMGQHLQQQRVTTDTTGNSIRD